MRPRVEAKVRRGWSLLNFWATWDIKDTGQIPVKLGLPEVKAGRCINKPNPNPKSALSPALTAPALWFGPVQNGKVQMYSASVSTYPGSSSSRIFLQELKTKTDPGRPAFPRRFEYAGYQIPRAEFQLKADRDPIAERRVPDRPDSRQDRGFEWQ